MAMKVVMAVGEEQVVCIRCDSTDDGPAASAASSAHHFIRLTVT